LGHRTLEAYREVCAATGIKLARSRAQLRSAWPVTVNAGRLAFEARTHSRGGETLVPMFSLGKCIRLQLKLPARGNLNLEFVCFPPTLFAMRRFFSFLALFLLGAVQAVSFSGSRLLVILDDVAEREKYGVFLGDLESKYDFKGSIQASIQPYGRMKWLHDFSYLEAEFTSMRSRI
jgi:hypothetical protein